MLRQVAKRPHNTAFLRKCCISFGRIFDICAGLRMRQRAAVDLSYDPSRHKMNTQPPGETQLLESTL